MVRHCVVDPPVLLPDGVVDELPVGAVVVPSVSPVVLALPEVPDVPDVPLPDDELPLLSVEVPLPDDVAPPVPLEDVPPVLPPALLPVVSVDLSPVSLVADVELPEVPLLSTVSEVVPVPEAPAEDVSDVPLLSVEVPEVPVAEVPLLSEDPLPDDASSVVVVVTVVVVFFLPDLALPLAESPVDVVVLVEAGLPVVVVVVVCWPNAAVAVPRRETKIARGSFFMVAPCCRDMRATRPWLSNWEATC